MLYRPEAFEPLTEEPWNADRVRGAVREIVADTDDALRGPKLMWRADDWDRWQATSPMKNLYVGAAGVLWALDELRRLGHAETRLDLAELALGNLDLYRARTDQMKIMLPSPGSRRFCAARRVSCWSPGGSRRAHRSPTTCLPACERTSRTRQRR